MQSELAHVKSVCGAKTRSGHTCQNAPMTNGRCRMHGGKSLSGVASPNYKTGRYSKYLPAGLTDKYHEALADEELESLSSELALVGARMNDVLSRIEFSEAGEAWKQMRQLYNTLCAAVKGGDAKESIKALAAMDLLIKQDVTETEQWQEVYNLIELRRKLSETERRRLVDMQQYITSQQAMLLVGTLLGIIKARVNDRNVLATIQQDVNALLASPR